MSQLYAARTSFLDELYKQGYPTCAVCSIGNALTQAIGGDARKRRVVQPPLIHLQYVNGQNTPQPWGWTYKHC